MTLKFFFRKLKLYRTKKFNKFYQIKTINDKAIKTRLENNNNEKEYGQKMAGMKR